MSRNLCTDKCDCGYRFSIPDFVGQPIEFRQYGDYKPEMGAKLVCPTCGKVYFGWMRTGWEYWCEKSKNDFDNEYLSYYDEYYGQTTKNEHKGKFAKRVKFTNDTEYVEQLGYYQIDLSYYESYNDEGKGVDTNSPAYLTTQDHELTWWKND